LKASMDGRPAGMADQLGWPKRKAGRLAVMAGQ
jgi:hypothetical protein